MARSTKIIVALLCLVCVLALCIAPYVDIPVTALRSLQTILLLMLALATALLLVDSPPFCLTFCRRILPAAGCTALHWSFFLPLEANCVLQC